MPCVVLEGRVTRRVGAISGENANDSRYIEVYVHDAIYGTNEDSVETPTVMATTRGHKLILPSSTSAYDRQRVATVITTASRYKNHQSLSVCLAQLTKGKEVHGGRTYCLRVTVL